MAALLITAEARVSLATPAPVGLTPSTLCCNDPRHAGRGAGSRVLKWIVDKGSNGNSTARAEWRTNVARYRNPMALVYGHLLRVDAAQTANSPQQQGAQLCQGTTPDLYWYDVGGIGAFYAWDGTDVMIVLSGAIANPPPPAFANLHHNASLRL